MHRGYKFLIGFFAGVVTWSAPKLSAQLALVQHNSDASFGSVSTDYILFGLLFACVVGGVTVIFESERHRTPREIFMGALAIPALLSGMVNTSILEQNADDKRTEIRTLEELLKQYQGPVIEDLTEGSAVLPVGIFITDAYAQVTPDDRVLSLQQLKSLGDNTFTLWRHDSDQYVVATDHASTLQEARGKLERWEGRYPDAVILQRNDESYYILESPNAESYLPSYGKYEKIRKESGSPSMLKIK